MRRRLRPRGQPRARPRDRAIISQVERLRVAWVDTDAGGRIHFTAAFRWAEAAETALRRRLGLVDDWGDYPRRHVEASFRRVLVFEDEIDVRIWPDEVGQTSITWQFEITRGGERCVDGRMVVVHVDGDGRASPLPEAVRSALSPPRRRSRRRP